MKQIYKLLSALSLFALLALATVTPAGAFDGRGGDVVVIKSGEVVNDDLYVGANQFTLEGTVNGDVLATGQNVTINGTVDGDVMAAGQTIVVNGTVTGSIRIAGAILLVGENASIGGDVISAGYSLETQEGSSVGQDVLFGGGQALLSGEVSRNVGVGTAAFELRGSVGGDVTAEVGEAGQAPAGPPADVFMPQSGVPVPSVAPGLTVEPSANIEGNLEYTQTRELAIPAGVVAGTISRNEPPVDPVRRETAGQKIATWALNLLRSAVTLVLIGLLLLWLFPMFMEGAAMKLQSTVWRSLGAGIVAYAGFFFMLLVGVIAIALGGVVFGLLTLGGLANTVIWVGILAVFALILGFVLATSFVAKIAFGQALGRWFLLRSNSSLAEHRFWPMIIGVVVTVLVIGLLSFPLIPGFLGGLLNFAVVLFGLGALWLWARERRVAQQAVG